MGRYGTLLGFFFFTGLIFSGEKTDLKEASSTREMVWNTYARMYATNALKAPYINGFETIIKQTWQTKKQMVDSLVFLNERARNDTLHSLPLKAVGEEVKASEVHYSPIHLAHHVQALYKEANPNLPGFIKIGSKKPITFSRFLVLADKLDGRWDAKIELPNIEGLYHLVANLNVPIAAVGFNFRERGQWQDRRSLIQTKMLDQELPRSLRRARASKVSDAKKLDKIVSHVLKVVKPLPDDKDSDYWQTPIETLFLGEGDCEDFAILIHTIAKWMGIKTQVVVGYCVKVGPNKEIERMGHAWVTLEERIIDPLTSKLETFQYEGKISFDSQDAFFTEPGTTEKSLQNLMASR